MVKLPEIAKRLGLKITVDKAKQKTIMSDARRRVEFEADSREVEINGLRVFFGTAVRRRGRDLYVSRMDYATRLVPVLRPSLIKPPPDPKVIVLDPGHGGVDNGMENAALSLKEKVLTLDVAQRVQKLLSPRGYKVVLTRKGDASLHPEKAKDFQRRIETANDIGADLFVSIHFNSLYPNTKIGGTEIYSFTRVGQRSDLSWGFGKSNDTEDEASPVNQFDTGSTMLADAIHRAVLAELKTFDRGHKTMHSAVLRGLKCPGVLVEAVFLSSEKEGKLASTAAYRQQIAEAIAKGIEDYADTVRSLRAKS